MAQPLKRFSVFIIPLLCGLTLNVFAADPLADGFAEPPMEARVRAYWWWLNGNVTKESITRDLEQMRAKGFGGALICDADGSAQDGNQRAPHGPTFFTPAWRELYRHTVREAERLGLELSLNIQSGWNLGGPMVSKEDAAKKLVWSEAVVEGPVNSVTLPKPKGRDGYYRDLFVVAYPLNAKTGGKTARLKNWQEKAVHKALHFSAPDTTPLLVEDAETPGEEETRASEVLNLTGKLDGDTLKWSAPGGRWQVIRIGCTIGDHSRVSTCSEGWEGYALDVLDRQAFRRYWDAVVEPLILDAGKAAGKTLKYLHTDSWEVEAINWTPTLREEFRKRRGYDMLAYLPALTGRIVDSRRVSNRFLNDFRKTIGDLAVDNHYVPFREWAAKHGMEIHPEAGGPHAVPIDAQRCLGQDNAPMSEFWAWSWRHRIGDSNRFFVKQPASAAHTYGHRLVLAEGFTTIGPHWQETLWDNLKPAFDHACSEGLNRLVWHAFVCSPESEGIPGQQYFAGTHLNPNVTWWEMSSPFFTYLNRCQYLLQRGLPVSDVLYYYGDHVPNFAQIRASDPAHVGPGFDYDVVTEEVILNRLSCKDGRLVLPEGTSYRLLALPNRTNLSLPVVRKLAELVKAGATVIGPNPTADMSLRDFPKNDAEVQRIAEGLWQKPAKGRVISGKSAREVLLADGVAPDFGYQGTESGSVIDYIHRRDGDAEIYFISSRSNRNETVQCHFRVTGKAPELWDAVTGERRFASDYSVAGQETTVRLVLPPYGSMFVMFREPATVHPATGKPNTVEPKVLASIAQPWTVAFDPKWGGPAKAEFPQLVSWTTRPEPGIRYYAGTATYSTTFEAPAVASHKLMLDLGRVREIAEVRVNGKSCGIVWAPPFRVDVSSAVKPGSNFVDVAVVNFWPNRIIGDAGLPQAQRLTKTNIRKLTKETPLMESGLLGPMTLSTTE